MNSRTLEYVVAVADLGKFRLAAEQCHVSQPTLSLQVRRLEEYLGIELFRRDAHGACLTEQGLQMIDAFRRVTAQIRAIKSQALELKSGARFSAQAA